MDKEFKKSIKRQDAYCDSAGEYVLPDYNGDVRKILFSEARVRPAGRFIGGDEAEFTGVVVYNVVYSDSEGKIGGVSFTSDYDFSVKNVSENVENVICDTRVANFAMRLMSPRKLSAKCSLTSSIYSTERLVYEPTGSAFEMREGAEKQTKELNVRNITVSEGAEREYAEALGRLEGAIEDEVKAVYSRADIYPESVTAEGGEAVIRGRLVMRALIENGEEPAQLLEYSKNIEESVPLGEFSEGMRLSADIVITSEKTEVRADEDGCEIVMDVIAEYSVLGDENKTLEVISDAFSTVCSVENSYMDIDYTELLCVLETKEKNTFEMKRSEVFDGVVREILYITAEPKLESVQPSSCGVKILGEIKYSGIASEVNDENAICYSVIKTVAPFECFVNNNCQNGEENRVDVKIGIENAEANIDDNNIYFSSCLDIKTVITAERKEKALVDCSAIEDSVFEKDEATVTVYYPDEGETLFSVAKKYHVSVSKLCDNNSVSASALLEEGEAVPKKLIIY